MEIMALNSWLKFDLGNKCTMYFATMYILQVYFIARVVIPNKFCFNPPSCLMFSSKFVYKRMTSDLERKTFK